MNEDVKSENVRIHSRADELIACLEGEIAKRDEVIVGLTNSRDFWREKAIAADDELAAIKAQGVVMPEQDGSDAQIAFWAGFEFAVCGMHNNDIRAAWNDFKSSERFKRLNAAPAAPAADAGYVFYGMDGNHP